jgi:hypothetical protein
MHRTPELLGNQGNPRPMISTVQFIFKGIIALFKFPLHLMDDLTARRKSQVFKTVGLDAIDPNLPILIYVHYSKSGVITEREVSTLQNAQNVGLQICLVVNLEKSQIASESWSFHHQGNSLEAQIIRKNIGWDLGAYRDAYFALKNLQKVNSQPIIFMNNSVIWFPEMIKNYFDKAIKADADVIAGSISNQYRPHIQTFLFGALNPIGTAQIEQWLGTIKNWRLKRTVVSYGEMGTSRILLSKVKSETLSPDNLLMEMGLKKIHLGFESKNNEIPYVVINRWLRNRNFMQAGVPQNPSHDYWLEMLENGFPGIKVDLIQSNPSNILDYEIVISKLLESGFDYKMISLLLHRNKPKSIVYKIRRSLKY